MGLKVHFELKYVEEGNVVVSFVSSKERIRLGELKFVDDKGRERGEIRELLRESVMEESLMKWRRRDESS
jgi:hypothetical protein